MITGWYIQRGYKAMRKGFTLIEILLVIGIMATIVTVGAVSFSKQSGAAKLRGATRGVFAAIRRARSEALVSGQPSVVSYSTINGEHGICAKVEIVGAKIMSGGQNDYAETISGEEVRLSEPEVDEQTGEGTETSGGGQSVEEILFSPIAAEVVEGVALKVVMEDEQVDFGRGSEQREKSKISVFSNVDYLVGRYSEAKEKESEQASAAEESSSESAKETSDSVESEIQEPVRVAWEVNGLVKPHRVYVYVSGSDPLSGYQIRIDRFGAAKVLTREDSDW